MVRCVIRKIGLSAGLLFVVSLVFSANALAVILPDPSSTFDGLPVAIPEDQFVSYSARLLTLWLGKSAGFDTPAGSGGLDLVLLTGSGVNNKSVTGGFSFEDPQPAVTGAVSSFSGTWGAGSPPPKPKVPGPVLVDDLLAYLHYNFGPTDSIPVFTFDMNQSGNGNDLNLNLVTKMSVYDPVTHTDVTSWALDAINNGTFDPSAYVLVPGVISLTGTSGTTYTVDNNKGSGKNDFIDYAPTMDLSLYAGHGYEFHIFTNMTNLDDGFEESWLSGAIAPPTPPPPVIPEPSSLLLLSVGLLGAAGFRGLRKSKF